MGNTKLKEILEVILKRASQNDFDDSPYVNPPARYIKIIAKNETGNNALFEDETGITQKIWQGEFKKAKNNITEVDGKVASKINPDFVWVLREHADFPVLVNKNKKPEPTNEATAIIGPDDENGVAPLWTIFPGPVAPPIENGEEDFWSKHYFANGR
jgi:hypothetical protein